MSLTGQRSPWLSVMLQGEIDSDLVMWFCSPSLLSLKPPMGSATRVYAYVGFCFCRYYTNKKSDAKIDVLELDLIPLASARAFAANYLSLDLPLHMLIYGRQCSEVLCERRCTGGCNNVLCSVDVVKQRYDVEKEHVGHRCRIPLILDVDCNTPKIRSQRNVFPGALLHDPISQVRRERPLTESFEKKSC
ncbi:hypothetical protein Tco_1398018, partial [Tanacetum coccineum]